MNLPDAFSYKGFLVCLKAEADFEFEGSFDFGDAQANAAYLAQYENGEILNVSITVRRFSDDDEPGELVDALGGVHLLNDGTVRAQVRRMLDDGELMTAVKS
jgi:hypothetical protein